MLTVKANAVLQAHSERTGKSWDYGQSGHDLFFWFLLFLHHNFNVFNFNVLITQNVLKIDTMEAV